MVDPGDLLKLRLSGRRSSDRRSPPDQRLAIIGLDAADADLVERGCAEGWLPVMRALREHGLWARLGTTAEDLHVSALPSLYTGTTPDKHGLYHAYVMRPGRQVPERPRPDESPALPFWKFLSDAGRRCIVMDAFMSCPVQPFRGVQVLEYGTWTWFWRPMTSPAGLRREILARFGPYPAENHAEVLGPPDCAGFRERLIRAARQKAEVVTWLMAREPWDLLFVVFGEPHPAGHYLWHLHDPSYPAHPPGGAGPLARAVMDVYEAVDQAIGRIVAAVEPGTPVIVVSADGMGPNYSGSHLLPELLAALGLYVTAGRRPRSGAAGREAARRDPVKRLRQLVPAPLRHAVSRHLLPGCVRERLSVRWMTADIDWSRTRAFLIDNANEGYIRVNLRGREPRGIVTPGPEYDALCETLVTALRGLVNPRTGRPATRAVWRPTKRWAGPCRDRLPDVVVSWEPGAELTTEVAGEACGLLRTGRGPWEASPYYTGNHRPAAFMIACGPGIPAGDTLAGLHVLDLAPTVLAHFGLPTPPTMDGEPVAALLAGAVA